MSRQPEHPDPGDIGLARLLSALGDPARLEIIGVLADREEHQRADFKVGVGASTLSYHMKTLREAGLTWNRIEGTRCYVSLREDTFARFCGVLAGILATIAEQREQPPQPH
jgi:DNA-binding transcriptional ArsR family regulator